MDDERLLAEVRALEAQPEGTGMSGWLLLGVSLMLFVGAGSFSWDLHFIGLVVVAIFVHELGHFITMKLFRYRNVKMMFIPFLGGAASGRPPKHDGFKDAIIALMGPIVGLVSVVFAIGLYQLTGQELLIDYIYIGLFINVFNLAPFLPLDGGHVVNEVLMARFPVLEVVFRLLGVAALGCFAFLVESILLGLLAGFIFVTLAPNYKNARIAKALREEEGMAGEELDLPRLQRIRTALESEHGFLAQEQHRQLLPRMVDNTWKSINRHFPGVGGSALIIVLYLGSALIAPALILVGLALLIPGALPE